MPLTVTFIYRCSHFFVKITFTFWIKYCLGSSLVEKLLSCSKYSRFLYANFTFIFWTCQYFPWSSLSIFFYFHDFFFEKKNFQGRGPARIPCGQRWGHPDILRPRQQVQVGEQEARWIARIHKWALQKMSLFFFPSKSDFFVFVITLSVSRGSEVSRLLIPFFEFLLPQTRCS